jgi:hypothetical protein
MLDQRSQEVPMFSVIRSSRRPATPLTRVTAALPGLRHSHQKAHRRVGPAAITRAVAGLVVVLIGTAVVIFRDKLASIVSRGHRGEEQVLGAEEHKPASIASSGDGSEKQASAGAEQRLASIASRGNGGAEQSPAAEG